MTETIETEIARLMALAEPLRSLDEEDPAKMPLAGIVDEINIMRAEQSRVLASPAEVEAAALDGKDKAAALAECVRLGVECDDRWTLAKAEAAVARVTLARSASQVDEKRKPGRPRNVVEGADAA